MKSIFAGVAALLLLGCGDAAEIHVGAKGLPQDGAGAENATASAAGEASKSGEVLDAEGEGITSDGDTSPDPISNPEIVHEVEEEKEPILAGAPQPTPTSAQPVGTPIIKPTAPPVNASRAFPMGVYWPGEYLYIVPGTRTIDWPRNEKALEDLASHNVTAVWLTHRYARETAEFARRAEKYGISVVASLGTIAGEVATIRNGNHEVLIKKTLSDWGNAPRPLAWGLGDEPRATYMNEMAKYVASWRKFAPGEPVTTVVMHTDVSAAKTLGFDALANDVYPFFSKDNPNRYMGREYTAWIDKTKILRASVNVPWMMGQTYQEPWGPIEIAPSGNIVYLPGSAPHWVMPSPKQVAWQTLAAVAKGAQGMFYFAYRLTPSPKLKWAPASKLPAKVSVPTDSGAPMGLVHMNGASTPQYEAMAEAFGWVAKHRPLLAKLRFAPAGEQLKVSGNYANAASVFVHSDSGKLYLIAASSYMSTPEAQAFRIVFASQAKAIRNIETGVVANLNAATDGMATVLRMPPATAAIFEIVKDN